jgi:hypothetical protein
MFSISSSVPGAVLAQRQRLIGQDLSITPNWRRHGYGLSGPPTFGDYVDHSVRFVSAIQDIRVRSITHTEP